MTPKLTSLSPGWLLDFSIWTYSSSISSSVSPNPNFHHCPKLLTLPLSTILFSLPQLAPPFSPPFPRSLHTSHHRFQYLQFSSFWNRHTSFAVPWHFLRPLLELVAKLFKPRYSLLLSFHTPLPELLSSPVLNSQMPCSASCCLNKTEWDLISFIIWSQTYLSTFYLHKILYTLLSKQNNFIFIFWT